jgi:Flp pilus assembly pilin Flp
MSKGRSSSGLRPFFSRRTLDHGGRLTGFERFPVKLLQRLEARETGSSPFPAAWRQGLKGRSAMTKTLKSFLRADSASTAVEYGLIAGILGVGLVAALMGVKNGFASMTTAANEGLTGQ